LHGQRVIVFSRQQHQGAAHYRIVTESGHQWLVPKWMCEPQTFDASPAQQIFIDPRALLDLQRLVTEALSSLESSPSGPPREEENEATYAFPTARNSRGTAGERAERSQTVAGGVDHRRAREIGGESPKRQGT
jgi:hypothetical protein